MQEIISIHIGQCGLQIGSALWELLTYEHSISSDGILSINTSSVEQSTDSFFVNCRNERFVPRAIFIDLEPNVIDEIKTGSFRNLFHPDQMINGTEDAGNNFARGYFTAGRIIKDICHVRIRREVERSERLQALHIYRSLGGGTGSGMTATIFEILSEFPKTTKLEIPIHPSPHLNSGIVEPYNCILTEHYTMDDIDISLLMDNEALYDIVGDEILIAHPTLANINRIVAQTCSSITASARYHNDLYNDFTVMTNLVPYPRIHYPLVSYSPLGNSSKLERNVNSVLELTRAVFRSNNQLVKCDPSSGKYMSCSLLYRGLISPGEVYSALGEIKGGNLVNFVDWCPTGFKVGIVSQPPSIIPTSQVGLTPINLIMMTNNSAVSTIWHRLSQKFHKLYSKRSFIHWFVSEGLEELEFCESLFNIATLAKDYEEVALDTEIKEDTQSKPNEGTAVENSNIMTTIKVTNTSVLSNLELKTSFKNVPDSSVPKEMSTEIENIDSVEKFVDNIDQGLELEKAAEITFINEDEVHEDFIENTEKDDDKTREETETYSNDFLLENATGNLANETTPKEMKNEEDRKFSEIEPYQADKINSDENVTREPDIVEEFDKPEEPVIEETNADETIADPVNEKKISNESEPRELQKEPSNNVEPEDVNVPEPDYENNNDNYNSNFKKQKNYSNFHLVNSSNSNQVTQKYLKKIIQSLSTNPSKTNDAKSHQIQTTCYVRNNDINTKTINYIAPKQLFVENESLSLFRRKCQLNKTRRTSLDDLESKKDEDRTQSLMEELIKITSQIPG